MRLWLIRHGETEHNLNGVFQGQLDTELTERGREQARVTAMALSAIPFQAIYSSDLMRAFQTAEALAERRDMPVTPDSRLRELHYGVLQGVAYHEFRAVLAEHGVENWGPSVFSENGVAPPQGESLNDLIARIDAFMTEVLDDAESDADVGVVTHGGTIRTIMTQLLGLPAVDRRKLSLANCGVTCFVRNADGRSFDGGWTLEFHNRVFWAGDIVSGGSTTSV